MSTPSCEPNRLRIGKVVGCHGLKGDLKIRPASEDPDWIEDLERLFLHHVQKGQQAFTILDLRFKDRLVFARLEGIADRTTAETWIGAEVHADKSELPEAEEGAYPVDVLVGLRVIDLQTGQVQGTLQDVVSSTGSDFLEIRLQASGQLVVVPFLEVFFPTVDLSKGEIYVQNLGNLEDLASQSSKAPEP